MYDEPSSGDKGIEFLHRANSEMFDADMQARGGGERPIVEAHQKAAQSHLEKAVGALGDPATKHYAKKALKCMKKGECAFAVAHLGNAMHANRLATQGFPVTVEE